MFNRLKFSVPINNPAMWQRFCSLRLWPQACFHVVVWSEDESGLCLRSLRAAGGEGRHTHKAGTTPTGPQAISAGLHMLMGPYTHTHTPGGDGWAAGAQVRLTALQQPQESLESHLTSEVRRKMHKQTLQSKHLSKKVQSVWNAKTADAVFI